VIRPRPAREATRRRSDGSTQQPLTTKFWAPDAFFANSHAVFSTIEYVETEFIDAHLIAITAFARAGQDSLAR
jgi:hypothetical protein